MVVLYGGLNPRVDTWQILGTILNCSQPKMRSSGIPQLFSAKDPPQVRCALSPEALQRDHRQLPFLCFVEGTLWGCEQVRKKPPTLEGVRHSVRRCAFKDPRPRKAKSNMQPKPRPLFLLFLRALFEACQNGVPEPSNSS